MRSRRPGQSSPLPLVGGLLIVAGLTIYDYLAGPSSIVIGTVVLGAFITGVLGTPRQTLVVAIAATAAVIVSGSWNDDFLDGPYLVRLLVVFSGGVIAVIAASAHERTIRDALRFETLGAIADVADGTLALRETAERIADVLVPSLADQCVIDTTIGSPELRRLTVRVDGLRGRAQEEFLRARPPTNSSAGFGSMATLASGRSQLIQADEAIARSVASSDDDLAGLLALGVRSMTVVPLAARGQALGTLTLVTTDTSARRLDKSDLEFHQIVAGRAALALDNAGLDRELRDAERQLGVALGALDEAVTIMDERGRTRYANAAAVSLLGFDAPEALYAAEPGELISLFDVFNEEGEPLSLADVPSSALLRGIEDPPPLLVRNVWRATGEERWLVQRSTAIRDERGAVSRVVNVIEDVTEMKRAELRARVLAEASDALASSMDFENTLRRVAELAVPALADWCAVSLPDERGFVRAVAVAHSDPAKVDIARDLGERYPEHADAPVGPAAVVRSGVTQRVDDVTDELLVAAAHDAEHLELLRQLGMRSGMTVPLRASGRTLGALSLASAESGRRFDGDDQELAEELGRRAGMAVENARLFTERSRITTSLQQGLLPPELPDLPDWEVAAYYEPAGALNDVGGDFYDMFQTPKGWMVIIGDVTGHGAEAARLTAVARFTLRAVAELTGDAITAISQLNRSLLREPVLSPVTLACVLLGEGAGDPASVEITCCGHPLPVVVGPGHARTAGSTSPLVGAFAEATWHSMTVAVRRGETLVLYTDGLTDARGADGLFGHERLLETLATPPASPSELVRHVAVAIDGYSAGPQRDDQALLALRPIGGAVASP